MGATRESVGSRVPKGWQEGAELTSMIGDNGDKINENKNRNKNKTKYKNKNKNKNKIITIHRSLSSATEVILFLNVVLFILLENKSKILPIVFEFSSPI